MIEGTGMLAAAMKRAVGTDPAVVFYAAGVSNSDCRDPREFERERARLRSVIASLREDQLLVYPGTCSVHDPQSRGSAYVAHKLAMEALVQDCGHYLILRLPQIAGRTPNPHTLLNYLYARIARGERFSLWRHAVRNVLDADDMALIARRLLDDAGSRNAIVNIAAPESHAVPAIVAAMEAVLGKRGVYDVLDKGETFAIDVARIRDIHQSMGGRFGAGYLAAVLRKYYGSEPR
jgi:nucleoside-diphosphate-sugar epimerase